MRMFSWRFYRVWQRNRDVFFRLWHFEMPISFIEPVLLLLAFGLGMGAYIGLVDGEQYINFIAPGMIAAYAMFSASNECSYAAFLRMEHQYTYDAILATPLNVEDITAGEIFWGATRAFMTAGIVLAISAVFRLVVSPWALLILPLAFVEGVLFGSISLFYTSIVPSIYSFNYFFTLIINPLFLLSGVFFPLDAFPEALRTASWFTPLRPVVVLVRALFKGESPENLWLPLGVILAYILVFFSLTLVTMRRRLTK
jgi:lipooligosaccharide transport system permease protein